MTLQEKLKFVILRSIGNFLVLFSLYGVVATFGPAMTVEAKYRLSQMRGIRYDVAAIEAESQGGVDTAPGSQAAEVASGTSQREGPTFGSVLTGPKQQALVPIDSNFSIIIPKIGASAKVFPNVDPTDENNFIPLLQKGIAHAKGTVFPGIPGNVYLFAHSTDNFWNVGRYNAIFYLLKDIQVQDDIVIFFEGRRYNYTVSEKKVVSPTEVSHLVQSHGGPEQLILQTCWPPGTTWQRLLVIAIPKSVSSI